jgi:hypothetical protein
MSIASGYMGKAKPDDNTCCNCSKSGHWAKECRSKKARPMWPSVSKMSSRSLWLRLSALMNLYIYPLYNLVTKILFSILNSSASIHPLYHPLSIVGLTCHFI